VDTTITIIGLIAAVLSALGALGAWQAARQANKASVQANAAAVAVAAIETERRHVELTPRVRLELEQEDSTSAILRVAVDGPDDLDRVDAVSVSIRDDIPNRAELSRSIGTQVSPEQIRAQIWGPLRFQHGTDGGSADGRSVEPFRLDVGESRPLLMRPTVPPPWSKDMDWWRRQYNGKPLRVTVTCTRDGYEPWVFQREVPRLPEVESQVY
jgi:hypothetical protein